MFHESEDWLRQQGYLKDECSSCKVGIEYGHTCPAFGIEPRATGTLALLDGTVVTVMAALPVTPNIYDYIIAWDDGITWKVCDFELEDINQ